MSRNNRNRLNKGLEQTKPADAETPLASLSDEGLFSFANPTEIVELPSKGRFYPEDHPLHNVAEIEIKHMTAKEEDILSSRSLLRKGIAIDRLLQSVIIDKRIKIDDLLIGDKNALLVATRITGYGEIYETSVVCPTCSTNEKYSFNLADLEVNHNEELPEEVELTESGTFRVMLPALKVPIELRLLTGREERYLTDLEESKRKKNLPESTVTDQLRLIICSVLDKSEGPLINQLINNLPTTDSRFIHNIYDQIVPNIDFRASYDCSSCDHRDETVGVPLTAAFFWPGR